MGVKFVTTEEISIVGVRFHKGDQNIGPHTGSLWSSNGTQLAHATFVNETVDGWQDVLFDDPVPMEPGQMYIASYHVPVGYYSAVNDYFETSITSGPVTALSGSEADGAANPHRHSFPAGAASRSPAELVRRGRCPWARQRSAPGRRQAWGIERC